MPILKNPKLVNYSEIGRQLGITGQYVKMIVNGQRKSDKYAKQIQELVSKEARPPRSAA